MAQRGKPKDGGKRPKSRSRERRVDQFSRHQQRSGDKATNTQAANQSMREKTPDGSTVVSTQSQVSSMDRSHFWPELYPENQAKVDSRDGESTKSLMDFRLECKAANGGYPIPPALKERQVYEAARTLMDPTVETKNRLYANRLLVAMEMANVRSRLPNQVQVNVLGGASVSVNEVLDELRNDASIVEYEDLREFKPESGSEDDYAD